MFAKTIIRSLLWKQRLSADSEQRMRLYTRKELSILPQSLNPTIILRAAALKVVLAPYTVGAKLWSASYDAVDSFGKMNWGAGSGETISLLSRAACLWADSAATAVVAGVKWWEAMGSFYGWRRR